jgi:predicted nucleic acid-binding protein
LILADTSVWIDHFRYGNADLVTLLNRQQIAIHPFVLGELALGSLKARTSTLAALESLEEVSVAHDGEVLRMIDELALFSKGLGYVDVHLLASVRLDSRSRLFTLDKRLLAVAQAMAISLT